MQDYPNLPGFWTSLTETNYMYRSKAPLRHACAWTWRQTVALSSKFGKRGTSMSIVRFEQPPKSLRQHGVNSVKSASSLSWVTMVKNEQIAYNALSLWVLSKNLRQPRTGNSLPRIHSIHVPRAPEIHSSKRDDQHEQRHRVVKSDHIRAVLTELLSEVSIRALPLLRDFLVK